MTNLQVIVGSTNRVKINAARTAFQPYVAGNHDLDVNGIDALSGVHPQPKTRMKTLRGAANRAQSCRSQYPDADYFVGIEGGLSREFGRLVLIGFVVVLDQHGTRGTGTCPEIPVPDNVAALIDQGYHLGTANDVVYGTQGSARAGGAEWFYTDGRINREVSCRIACIDALSAFAALKSTYHMHHETAARAVDLGALSPL